jgi:hypothetical protein
VKLNLTLVFLYFEEHMVFQDVDANEEILYPHECQGAAGFKAAATQSLDTEVALSVGVLVSSNPLFCDRLKVLSVTMLFLEQEHACIRAVPMPLR